MPAHSAVLDIVALRSLVAVADCGGFHRAAENLVVSQSAVSQHIRRLEKTINRPLVERVGRSSRFTPEGEALVSEARRILAAHDEALRRIRVGDERRSLVIGTTEHAADELLGLVTGALSDVFPDSASGSVSTAATGSTKRSTEAPSTSRCTSATSAATTTGRRARSR